MKPAVELFDRLGRLQTVTRRGVQSDLRSGLRTINNKGCDTVIDEEFAEGFSH